MADVLSPGDFGYDPSGPGGGTATGPLSAPGASGFDWSSLLSALGGPSGLAAILGGALPSLGALASGGVLGTTNTNNTGANAFSGTTNTNQTQNFNNLVNQLLSGNTFQNQIQNQTGQTNVNQATQGGFGQQQQGGFGQQQQGGFGQQQAGGFGQTTAQQNLPIMMPEAQAAGARTGAALQQLMPNAQNLWGQGAGMLGQLGPQAMDMLTKVMGPGPIPMPTADLIKQAFDPFIQTIADQAITGARNAGFAGGADLLGGAASPLAGRALAQVPGQEAAALLQAQSQVPLSNAQIQQMQSQALLGALQGGSNLAGMMMNPLGQAIQQNLGLVSAYPTGQNVSGNTTGTNFSNAGGTNFGNVSGTNFGNTTGNNFQNVNSQSLQNMMNSINSQGGFNQTGQTQQTGTQQNIGQTTQQGAGTTSNTGQTQQSVPIPSLVGSAVGGGITGLAGQQQNDAFMNLLSRLFPANA